MTRTTIVPATPAPVNRRKEYFADVPADESPDARFLRLYHRARKEHLTTRRGRDRQSWFVTSSNGADEYLVRQTASGYVCGCPYSDGRVGYVCKHAALVERPDTSPEHAAPACPRCGADLWLRVFSDHGVARCPACCWVADFSPETAYDIMETFMGWATPPANLDSLMVLLLVCQDVPPPPNPRRHVERRKALANAGTAALVRPPAFNDAWDALYEGGR